MKSQYILPLSIVVVGALIAGALFLISRNPSTPQSGGATAAAIRPVDSTDHIYGNPDAPVKIVEYADLECPYCKQFELTMDQLMQYYGASGKVAWVFRNFPLTQIHQKAAEEAQAAECVAAQGGSSAFFKFIDKVYSVTQGEDSLDLSQLPAYGQDAGVDGTKLSQCLAANTYAAKVQSDYNEAMAAGLQGTPHIVIMTSAGAVLALDGDQPYASMRAAIDQVLSSIGQSVSTSTPAQ